MRLSSRNYRRYLHSSRSHPELASQAQSPDLSSVSKPSSGFHFLWSATDLNPFLFGTTPIFLGLEIFIEARVDSLPMGISFPFGFLLFWALLYTYKNPSLSGSQKTQTNTEFKTSSSQGRVRPEQIFIRKEAEPEKKEPALPPDIQSALKILGLQNCRDWAVIHKRYRELAKQVHPDLNPELTAAENKFILYDSAYRKLSAVKNLYFKEFS